MNIIAVFKGRAETIDFCDQLRSYGIPSQIISTPLKTRGGCGLSCKFPAAFRAKAENAVRKGGYSAFVGFYSLQR